jgi:hypothetical protein
MAQPIPVFGWATAAPTAATEYHQAGEVLINSGPAGGEYAGWVCTVAGYPGTWKPFGYVDNGAQTLTAVAQAIPVGYSLTLLNVSAGGNTLTLSPAASHAAGFEMRVKNIAAESITLVTAAGAEYDAAAITLAQDGSVTIVGNGTQWYLVA